MEVAQINGRTVANSSKSIILPLKIVRGYVFITYSMAGYDHFATAREVLDRPRRGLQPEVPVKLIFSILKIINASVNLALIISIYLIMWYHEYVL